MWPQLKDEMVKISSHNSLSLLGKLYFMHLNTHCSCVQSWHIYWTSKAHLFQFFQIHLGIFEFLVHVPWCSSADKLYTLSQNGKYQYCIFKLSWLWKLLKKKRRDVFHYLRKEKKRSIYFFTRYTLWSIIGKCTFMLNCDTYVILHHIVLSLGVLLFCLIIILNLKWRKCIKIRVVILCLFLLQLCAETYYW